MKKVVFICTGNTCRSPMAEAIFNHIVKERNIKNVKATSCGVFAIEGQKLSDFAKQALEQKGIKVGEHKSKQMVSSLFDKNTLAIGMTHTHAQLASGYGESECISNYNGQKEISDPYGGDLEMYENTAEEIYAAVERLIDEKFSQQK